MEADTIIPVLTIPSEPTVIPSNEDETEIAKRRASPNKLYESTQNAPANKRVKIENGEAALTASTKGPESSMSSTTAPTNETASDSMNKVSPETTISTRGVINDGMCDGGQSIRPRRSAVKARTSVREVVAKARSDTKKTRKVESTEEEFKTAWICVECKEAECMMHRDADQLLICEGSCRRLFHYPCAGLSKPPAEEESYICQDCRKGSHVCALCQNYGTDNEDVFPCCATKCGLYYHEACLQLRDVEIRLVPTVIPPSTSSSSSSLSSTGPDDGNDETKSVPHSDAVGTHWLRREFKCPAHCCWTCTQKDLVEKERKETAESRKGGKKKGRKKSKPVNASFGQKTDQLTIRCLVCPNSYHLTCIPPPARFNELSLLCPDHVGDNKLPDVDPETSLQTLIEKKIDAKYAQVESPSRRRRKKAYQKNPFFHGMDGTAFNKTELELISGFQSDIDNGPIDTLFYCLPCNIRDEVHAKPPSYKHIHTLKYNPKDSPPQIKQSGDRCSCVDSCDESCYNRLLYVECTRDKDAKDTNCAVGKTCGNRRLGQRQFKKCLPKREKGRGWGLVVQEAVKKGELITEYVGEVINEKTKKARLDAWEKEHPNDPNFYIMGLGKGWYVDARDEANLSRFINHSCDPNGIVHTINVNGYLRNGIFALRDIPAGTFLSYDYHFETIQGDRFVCRCGSLNCRGTMKDRIVPVDDDDNKSKKQLWEAAKRDYDRDVAFLEDFHAKQQERRSQVDDMVPDFDIPSDLVSNGPHERHRDDAVRKHVFLWRNTRLGANFARRFARLENPKKQLHQHGYNQGDDLRK